MLINCFVSFCFQIGKRYELIIAFFFISVTATAQFNISGSLVDLTTNENIEAATVRLLTKDSVFVKGTSTSDKGKFTLKNIDKGHYILATSYIGYRDLFIGISNLKDDLKLDTLFMESNNMVLQNVTVQASRVIEKIDKKILFPTAEEKKISNNGLTLLRNMQLPNILINPINKTIETIQGGNAAIYLNGIPSSAGDIIALNPNEIVRIEYHDEPGLRYNNAPAVVDFITRRKVAGGNVSMDLNNALAAVGVSNNSFSAKYNYKRSEFGVNGSWDYRKVNWTRENKDAFALSDRTIERNEIGEPTKYLDNGLKMALTYNLREVDKYVLQIALRNSYKNIPDDFTNRVGTLYASDAELPISISDKSTDKGNTPSLDIYYQQNLKKKQLLILNIVGTHMESNTSRRYTEMQNGQVLLENYSLIKGNKNSIIAEGIYEKSYQNAKLTGGLKHAQNYVDNTYAGNVASSVNMKYAETYAYVEYQFRKKKINGSVGVGGTRTYTSQGDKNKATYLFRPSFKIQYRATPKLQFRYSMNVANNVPGLAAMNEIEQVIDSFQIRRGNPDLYTSISYNNNITVSFNHKIISVYLFAGYNHTDNAIMESIFRENNKFIRMQENQKYNQTVFANLAISIRPIKYISINLTPGIRHYINRGNTYSHTYTNLFLSSSILGNYKNWSLYADIKTRRNELVGETLSKGELLHTISLGYNSDRWSVGVGMINPFTKEYWQDSRNLSNLASSYSKVYSNDMGRIVMLNFSWNFNWGVKYQTVKKRIDNVDTDAGIISGKRE